MNDLMSSFKELGFNSYEATAYLTLLQNPNITAYEIGKISGIPQSKVYQAVQSLVSQGIINVVGEKPAKYVPLPLEEILARSRQKVEEACTYIEKSSHRFNRARAIDFLWHLEGAPEVWGKAKEMVQNAEKTLQIEGWGSELEKLEEIIPAPAKKGVKMIFTVYGDFSPAGGYVYRHPLTLLHQDYRQVGRWFVVLKDQEEALFATFNSENTQGVRSGNESFVAMVKEYMIHNIYVTEIYNRMGERLDKELGENLSSLKQELKGRGFDISL